MNRTYLKPLLICFLYFILNSSFAVAEYSYELMSPKASDLSADAAANIALQHVLHDGSCISLSQDGNTYDFHLLELTNKPIYCKATYVCHQQQGIWIISLFPEDIPILAATVTVSSPSGTIIDATFGYTVTMLRKWEAQKGSYYFWSLEDKYMFDTLYSNPMQSEIHVLPNETDISLEEAKHIASEAVASKYNLPLSSIFTDFLIEYNLVYLRNQNSHIRQWMIDFRKENSNRDDYDLFYWVHIDASTGDVLSIEINAGGFG